jgi:hypothetical protein
VAKPLILPQDRRQRVAAALLITAIDLPAPLDKVAGLALTAGRICPDMSVQESMMGSGRRRQLEAARRLIDDMLDEARS